jgi:taurine--2-oxoglutarate transaminase
MMAALWLAGRERVMEADEIVQLNREHVFFSWSVQSQVSPIAAVRGDGVHFWDADGKRYLDFSSQLMNVNIGHGNARVIAAVKEQVEKLAYVYPGIATEPKGRLGKLLAEITPGELSKTLFTLGGAEANENAIKFARLYTGRQKIITRYRSYHGATAGAQVSST